MAGDAWGGTWASWATSWTRSDYTPVTDDEFEEWLVDTTKLRCWLAEFSATGYDAGSPQGAKTVNLYLANMAFASHSTDTPPSQFYSPWIAKIPTFHSEIGPLLSGKASTGFGKFVITNPASATSGPGVRDDWTRVKFKRDYITLYLGDPEWRKADFRRFIVGVIDQPSTPDFSLIEFDIADILERLNRPLQVNRYVTGPMAGKLKPILQGAPLWMEPVPISDSTLELQLNDGPIEEIGNDVFDDGVSLTSSGEIASVDDTTETITTVVPHGLSADSRVWFFGSPSDPPPAPLAAETYYYVISAGLGASTFRLSATRGGSAINLTNTDAGAVFSSYGWWEDLSIASITPATQPAGRIMVKGAKSDQDGGDLCKVSNVISELIFDRFGLSEDFKDQDSFDDLVADLPDNVGVVFYDHDMPTALDALDRICKGTNCWYGSTPDGTIRVGRISLPDSTSAMDFIASEVRGLKLKSRLLPLNWETLAVRVSRQFYLNGPLNLAPGKEPELLRPYYTKAGNSPAGTGSTPLDDHPELADTFDAPPMDSYFRAGSSTEPARLQTLFKRTIGIFTFETTLKAVRLKLGQTIQLEHPRLGWKVYDGSDPQSPDNNATFDATKAVVIGMDVTPSAADAFKVALTVFRQIPGYYPTGDLS